MTDFNDTVTITRPWSDWLFLAQQRDQQGGGGFHVHNPWGNSTAGQGAADRNRLEIAYRTPDGQDRWGQFVLHGPSGNVGIGTATPRGRLEVSAPWGDWLFLRQERDTGGGGGFHIHNPWGNSNVGQGAPERNRLEIGYRTAQGSDLWAQVVVHGPTGNVGLGIGNPQARLHVHGNVIVTGDIALPNADVGEQFQAAADEAIEPGTVVVIGDEGEVTTSTRAYDTRVAGVVSGAGEFKPALVLDKKEEGRDRVTLALVGKVCCKVDATTAPVAVGDLLTTSDTPGYAMKADPQRAHGAVLGKALRPLASGRGLIPVLVALQ